MSIDFFTVSSLSRRVRGPVRRRQRMGGLLSYYYRAA
jgi:hypothetical protein